MLNRKYNRGFTLIEILLVIAIIAILTTIVILAINPSQSLAKTRDLQRKIGISEIDKSLSQYYIDKGHFPSDIVSEVKSICVTGSNPTSTGIDCTGKVDLSMLVPTYLTAIPTDPTGVGYEIGLNDPRHIMIIANRTEAGPPIIAIGTTTSPVVAEDQSPTITTGSGTVNDPYHIDNWSQLNHVRDDLTKNYILTANLSASSYNYAGLGDSFQPIGSEAAPFTGNFNGNGHTISDLIVNLPSINYVGLFGYSYGNISNLGLLNINVTGNLDVGGLAGMFRGTGTISNSYSTGNVNSLDYGVGGLVGQTFDQVTINNSHSTATIFSSNGNAGGLVGMESSGTISNSYSTGSVNSSSGYDAGGLVGYAAAAFNPASISNSYSTGSVTGGTTIGVGGLVGTSNPSVVISNSYSIGSITGGTTVGGLIGRSFSQPIITSSYWDIDTSGQLTSDGGTGTTTEAMKVTSTYDGWNTSIWNLANGNYPTLK